MFMKVPGCLDQGLGAAPAGGKGSLTCNSGGAAAGVERLRRTNRTMIRIVINRKSVPATPPTRRSTLGGLVVLPLLPGVVLVVEVEFPPVV